MRKEQFLNGLCVCVARRGGIFSLSPILLAPPPAHLSLFSFAKFPLGWAISSNGIDRAAPSFLFLEALLSPFLILAEWKMSAHTDFFFAVVLILQILESVRKARMDFAWREGFRSDRQQQHTHNSCLHKKRTSKDQVFSRSLYIR